MSTKTVTLLVVEDDEVDVMGIQRTLESLKLTNPLVIADDGVDALDMLRGKNGRDKLEPPYVILLDLNMPRMNGIEFLDAIRSDPELKQAIIFILTTSESDADIMQAFKYDVAGYIVKSDMRSSFLEAANQLNFSWTMVESQ